MTGREIDLPIVVDSTVPPGTIEVRASRPVEGRVVDPAVRVRLAGALYALHRRTDGRPGFTAVRVPADGRAR